MGRGRDGRRPGGRREQRYDQDYDMSRVTERFTNPTYVPKDSRYFLVSVVTNRDTKAIVWWIA